MEPILNQCITNFESICNQYDINVKPIWNQHTSKMPCMWKECEMNMEMKKMWMKLNTDNVVLQSYVHIVMPNYLC